MVMLNGRLYDAKTLNEIGDTRVRAGRSGSSRLSAGPGR